MHPHQSIASLATLQGWLVCMLQVQQDPDLVQTAPSWGLTAAHAGTVKVTEHRCGARAYHVYKPGSAGCCVPQQPSNGCMTLDAEA